MLLYSLIAALFSHHQRDFLLWQQMGVGEESHRHTWKQRESILEVSIGSLFLEIWDPLEKGREKDRESEGIEDTRRIWHTEATKQGSNGLTESGAVSKDHAKHLHQVLCIYSVAVTLVVFVGLLTVRAAVSLTLWSALEILFFILGCLLQS